MPPEFFLKPRLKSINFYHNRPNTRLFLQKVCRVLGLRSQIPNGLRRMGAEYADPRGPNNSSPIADSPLLGLYGTCAAHIFPSFRILQREVIELAK